MAKVKIVVGLSVQLWVEYCNYLNINLPGKNHEHAQMCSEGMNEMILFISNVVEKCVTHATRDERRQLIDEIISSGDG